MQVKITKNYLVLPTNTHAKGKKLVFKENGKEVYALDIRLDDKYPDFYAYIDVRRFLGKTLSVEIFPDMKFSFSESDGLTGEYDDPLLPYIHFTTKRGWNNDPNGLVKIGDEYHLFYQHNPAERAWGNMHWGHAVSKDLFHWKELPTALFPDETGMMFSGCAIVDERNVSRLACGEDKATLLFYTAAGYTATQCMAYSTDGLKTIKKYEKNPVLNHIFDYNRDPKIAWCEELRLYVMALFLTGEEYALYTSENLIDWKELQRLNLPSDNECPNFYPLYLKNGEKKWVLIGAHDCYYVGDFVGGKFVPCQEVKQTSLATDSYAAQTYTDMRDSRVIRIAWNVWHGVVAKTFTQQMGIPCDVFLEEADGEYYLAYRPVGELKHITENTRVFENVVLDGTLKEETGNCALGISLEGAYPEAGKVKIVCFGVEISIDFAKNEIAVGEKVNPISIKKTGFDLQIIADRSGIEVFSDGGKIAFAVCEKAICDGNLPYTEISSDCKYLLKKLTFDTYASTWEKDE